MAIPKIANWVAETTNTLGTGDIQLTGAIAGFVPFAIIGSGQVYYTVQEGFNKEIGIGTLDAQTGILTRDTIFATFVNNRYIESPNPMDLKGYAEVFCTIPAEIFAAVMSDVDDNASSITSVQQTINQMLTKLNGIENGATADQNASEVPVSNSNNADIPGNVQDALDDLWNKRAVHVVETTPGASYDLDVGAATSYELTLTEAVTTLRLTNQVIPSNTMAQVVVTLHQGTGANKVTWDQNIKWAHASAPTLSFDQGKTDIYLLTKLGTGDWYGSSLGGWYD